MFNFKKEKIKEKNSSSNNNRGNNLLLPSLRVKVFLSPFRGYPKATSSGRGCLLHDKNNNQNREKMKCRLILLNISILFYVCTLII